MEKKFARQISYSHESLTASVLLLCVFLHILLLFRYTRPTHGCGSS